MNIAIEGWLVWLIISVVCGLSCRTLYNMVVTDIDKEHGDPETAGKRPSVDLIFIRFRGRKGCCALGAITASSFFLFLVSVALHLNGYKFGW